MQIQSFKRGDRLACTIIEVFDGDTILVTWADELGIMCRPDRIRLARIDAAERRPHSSPAAESAWLALSNLALSKSAIVIPRLTWPDCYGRIVADVLVDGLDLSTGLLRLGVVVPWNRHLRRAANLRRRTPLCRSLSRMLRSNSLQP